MTTPTEIAIIGAGKVGTAIGVVAKRAGYTVTAVGARRLDAARRAAAMIGQGVEATDPIHAFSLGSLVFLAVPDDAIERVATELREARHSRDESTIVHLSGALTSSILQPLRERFGCNLASAHPLQTFPTVAAAVEKLPGAYWFCEGDSNALALLRRFVGDIGSTFVEITPAAKVLYHASAVFASNYLVALIDSALSCGESAGIDRGDMLPALGPLMDATIANIRQLGTAQALTGPIARGDCGTVRNHISAIEAATPGLTPIYKALATWTLELAVTKGTLSTASAEELKKLLNPY